RFLALTGIEPGPETELCPNPPHVMPRICSRPRVTFGRSYSVARTLRRDPISALPPLARGRALAVAFESQAVIPKRSRPANSRFSVNPLCWSGADFAAPRGHDAGDGVPMGNR